MPLRRWTSRRPARSALSGSSSPPESRVVYPCLTLLQDLHNGPATKSDARHCVSSGDATGCWQSDFTHVRLADDTDVEVITWLDDYSRYALHISAHPRITVNTVVSTFTRTTSSHGLPAATLTDNGLVYTARYRGDINRFEKHLRAHDIEQRNGTGNHPQTQGKVERFQQTMKKWLAATEPATTIAELNTRLNAFATIYNTQRVQSAKKTTPYAAYISKPKDTPSPLPADTTRYRHDRIDRTGKVSLRYDSRMYSIGVGRTHARTRVVLIIKDRHITIVDKTTGEVIRDLTLDPTRRYQKQ
ncbi:transposase family protein [Brevibacterium sp. CS2]|nr:transposase family protein [Brevibacterium sp. CS2]